MSNSKPNIDTGIDLYIYGRKFLHYDRKEIGDVRVKCKDAIECAPILDELAKEGEPVSKDLEEAAIDFADNARKQLYSKDYAISSIADYDHGCIDGFKAGAEWQYQKDRGEFAKIKAKTWSEGFDACKEQMMKDAVEGEIGYWNQRGLSIRLDKSLERLGYDMDTKVKIVIEKQDDRPRD